jgi:hypothetical protein
MTCSDSTEGRCRATKAFEVLYDRHAPWRTVRYHVGALTESDDKAAKTLH